MGEQPDIQGFLKHPLVVVGVVAVLVVSFYFVVSPYQNCMVSQTQRALLMNPHNTDSSAKFWAMGVCQERTSW